jgi:SAM-dependent methyltransferase
MSRTLRIRPWLRRAERHRICAQMAEPVSSSGHAMPEPPRGTRLVASRRSIDRVVLIRRLIGIAALVTAATGLAFLVTRLGRSHGPPRPVAGDILIDQVGIYDRVTGTLLAPYFRSVAEDIAATTTPSAKVLDVGCGPGHLSGLLAADHGLDVTGLDLDPAMIERARANAPGRSPGGPGRAASFLVGDVAALPFEPGSFDLVVSTFSLHHWADPGAGIGEIARVLRPGGRALIWDLGSSVFGLFHGHVPDPSDALNASDMRLISARPWRWPWRFSLSQRIELVRD